MKNKSMFLGIKLRVGKINEKNPFVQEIVLKAKRRQIALKNTIPTGTRLRKLFREVVHTKKAA